ncbi:GNAT family N-acetyltransferase [Streptococcus sciuri]|uniref:GNAT family N-acetyltransferase n=1 Tax=Streptococcus sciuri TaxID=2973939 RepID=A0ABT2F5S5_9STRE|nr:GNAT family N-acetyltransferase [Streptococcus sciuri]MCS4487787.1 GNAT family N-acetyltransferase [Streptococcus sciuri]
MNIWMGLAQFATFETERLILRPFTFTDERDFWEITKRPSNLRFIFPSPKTKEESSRLMVERFMRMPLGIWAIELKTNQQMIGAISFDKLDCYDETCEIGYFLKESEWGCGYMTEALKNIVFLAFYELKLARLTIITHEENKASQRVAQKAGFTLLRYYKGSDRYTHQMSSYAEYALSRKDYHYE